MQCGSLFSRPLFLSPDTTPKQRSMRLPRLHHPLRFHPRRRRRPLSLRSLQLRSRRPLRSHLDRPPSLLPAQRRYLTKGLGRPSTHRDRSSISSYSRVARQSATGRRGPRALAANGATGEATNIVSRSSTATGAPTRSNRLGTAFFTEGMRRVLLCMQNRSPNRRLDAWKATGKR